MRRIRSFSCLLLLSLSLIFLLLVSPCLTDDDSLEAAPEAKNVAPVELDPIIDPTPGSPSPSSSSTTEAPFTTHSEDPDDAEEVTTQTPGPDARADVTDSDGVNVSEAGSSSTASGSSESSGASSPSAESSSDSSSTVSLGETSPSVEAKTGSTVATGEEVIKEPTAETSNTVDGETLESSSKQPESSSQPFIDPALNEVVESTSDVSSPSSTSTTSTPELTPDQEKGDVVSSEGLPGSSSEGTSEATSQSVASSSSEPSSPMTSSSSTTVIDTSDSEDLSHSGSPSLPIDESSSPVEPASAESVPTSSSPESLSPEASSSTPSLPTSLTAESAPSESLFPDSSPASLSSPATDVSASTTGSVAIASETSSPTTGTTAADNCSLSQFGCCPDAQTPASGPDGAGCGCRGSLHGCCPDDKTPARGANQTGCPCDSLPHKCCPDRLTPASGPENEGCACSTMPFGCCPNSTAAATGPLFDGCNCVQTPYGCCPNGRSVAIGPKFEGCPDGTPLDTRLSSQACALPRERGTCRNYTIKWTYDMEYGGCIRFWYGGCEGNANRFQSQQECERVCVSPEGSEACQLPKVEGPCDGNYPSFYFNSGTGTCESFNYGGCLGNGNRFDTLEACTQLCLSTPSKDPCDQPVIHGPCRGFHPRWYYSKQDDRCRRFNYGGCHKNENNFETETACRAKCASSAPQELCILPKSEGPCLGQYPRWFYDYLDQGCKEFVYTGCEGNRNQFVDKLSCERTCNQTQVVVNTDICSLPKSEGPCRGTMMRWHFNTASMRCEQFYYGGCQGNANKFESRVDCERACAPAEHQQNPCLLKLDTGLSEGTCMRPFYNLEERWFYNQSDQVCHRFYYTGCGGNGNNFRGLDECQDKCGRPSPPPPPAPTAAVTTSVRHEFQVQDCTLPQDHGPCPNNELMWWYDHQDGVCKEFYYGGCSGNNNRFHSRKECEMKCWNSQDICKLKKVRGPCTGKFVQWHYDADSDQCLSFSYSGCSGNANRFSQKESCETQCKMNHVASSVIPYGTPAERENIPTIPQGNPVIPSPAGPTTDPACLALMDHGTCHAYVPQYYYDANENICRSFVYTGCGGNGNRFANRPQCEARCVASREEDETLTFVDKEVACRLTFDVGTCSETHARWFYDPSSFSCVPFVYTGCAGNKNRFKSSEICNKFCQGIGILNTVVTDQPHQTEEPEEPNRNKSTGRSVGPYPYPVFTTPSTTTPMSTTKQRELCKYECSDSQYFADCELIVQHQFCHNPYYAKFCCKTCFLNNQLDIGKVKEVIIGSESNNYRVLNDGTRICFFENTV